MNNTKKRNRCFQPMNYTAMLIMPQFPILFNEICCVGKYAKSHPFGWLFGEFV